MKKLFAAAFLSVLFAATQAHAVFTYIPEEQATPSPIVQENAKDVLAGNPLPQANPLVLPKETPLPQASMPAQNTVSQAAMPSMGVPTNPKVGIGPSTASQKEINQAEALIQKARKFEGSYQTQNVQPVYQQPVYQQPVYQQPVYQQPAQPVAKASTSSKGKKGKKVEPNPAATIQPVYQPTMPAYMANAMVQGAPPLVIGKGSMREQLMRYAGSMGYQVAWNCPNDLIVTNETVFSSGTFAGNLKELFETLQRIGRRDMSATLFQGNRTLVVEPARR